MTKVCCFVWAGLFLGTWSATAHAALIDVDFQMASDPTNLPYSEDGFTFTLLSGDAIIAGSPDRELSVNLPGGATMTQVRVSSATAFDFLSFDLARNVVRDWRIVSSSGAELALPHGTAAGTVNLAAVSGWMHLTHFDIIHDANQANAVIRFDNFMFESPSTSAPEPSSLVLMMALCAMSGVAVPGCRRMRRGSVAG